jgi:hypothetical protein
MPILKAIPTHHQISDEKTKQGTCFNLLFFTDLVEADRQYIYYIMDTAETQIYHGEAYRIQQEVCIPTQYFVVSISN